MGQEEKRNNGRVSVQYGAEYKRIFEITTQVPELEENNAFQDIINFFHSILFRTNKQAISEIAYNDLVGSIDKYIFADPRTYDFYFRLGRGILCFPEGYQLGNGSLYSFKRLPDGIRKSISMHWKYDYQENKEYARTFKDYKNLRGKDWYMHIQTIASGWFKAEDKAIRFVTRNINIYKLVYLSESSLNEDLHGFRNPFDYCCQPYNGSPVVNKQDSIGRGILLDRVDNSFDHIISDINIIINKKNLTDIEERILTTIDMFGMINETTPLHVRFLLCIGCLEALLMGSEDKDYLGKKLAEKITLLLGDSWVWFATLYNFAPENENNITLNEDFMKKNLTHARAELDRKIHELYGKRSKFTHTGLRRGRKGKSNKVTSEDYRLTSSILRWAVEKILELRKYGIEHINANREKGALHDEKSLDVVIEKLKY